MVPGNAYLMSLLAGLRQARDITYPRRTAAWNITYGVDGKQPRYSNGAPLSSGPNTYTVLACSPTNIPYRKKRQVAGSDEWQGSSQGTWSTRY